VKNVPAFKPERQQKSPKSPGPSIRHRFVVRATTVRADPLFLEQVTEIRRTWSQAHPEFSLSLPEWAPDPLPEGDPVIVFPPKVELFASGAVNQDAPENVQQAGGHWIDLVMKLCRSWWPIEYGFHNWLAGFFSHPAALFVSACLLWRPESVSEESIVVGNLGPQPIPFDPRDEWAHPGAMYWRMYASTLAKLIDDAITDGGRIDETWGDRAARAASQAAWMERAQTLRSNPDEMFWYLPLFPGVKTSDGKDLVSNIHLTLTAVYGDDPVGDRARDLKLSGLSNAKIAKLLGTSTKTIARWLKAA